MTKMPADEEDLAASALADILVSVMHHAYGETRRFLYCWERDGLRWLLRYHERRPTGAINSWIVTFMALNYKVILDDSGDLDFNLRAYKDLTSER